MTKERFYELCDKYNLPEEGREEFWELKSKVFKSLSDEKAVAIIELGVALAKVESVFSSKTDNYVN